MRRQPARVLARPSCWISSSVKPASSRRSANSASPSSTGGFCTAGRGRSRAGCAPAPIGADALEPRRSQEHLPVYGGGEAALDQRAALGQLEPARSTERSWLRELGMRDDDVAARPPRAPRRRRRTSRRGPRCPVASTSRARATTASTARSSGSGCPSSSTTGTGSPLDARARAARPLNAHPHRHLARRAAYSRSRSTLVDRVDGRHPDDPRALARRDLDRERVDARRRRG